VSEVFNIFEAESVPGDEGNSGQVSMQWVPEGRSQFHKKEKIMIASGEELKRSLDGVCYGLNMGAVK
jgi:hypothetical protein